MKHFLKKTVFVAMVLATCAASAQTPVNKKADRNIFNHLGVGVNAATTGFGFELSTPVTNYVALRAGINFMPGFSFTTDVDGRYTADTEYGEQTTDFTMDLKGGLKRTQGDVIFNIYPFGSHNAFYVAAGAYFGGKDILSLKGHSDELMNLQADNPYVEIGDYQLPVDENGNVDGSLRVNSFRPYLGLGYGRAIPKKRVNFGVELGVQFMGHMKVYSGDEVLQVKEYNDDDWQKWIDKLTVYPVLKFTISGRIF